MPTPILELILVELESRLGAISTGNGYETTTTGVVRQTRLGGFQPKNYQIVLKQENQTQNEGLSCPGSPPAIAWDLTVNIIGIVRASETETDSNDTLKNTFCADIIKSITSVANWHQMDGNAINSMVGTVEDFESPDGTATGFTLPLTIIYRVSETDPYERR